MNIWHKHSLTKVESEPVDTNLSDVMLLEDDFLENSNTPEMIIISYDEDTYDLWNGSNRSKYFRTRLATPQERENWYLYMSNLTSSKLE